MEAIQDLRKFLLNCNIAGFTYGEGCIVMEELKVGTELTLVRDKYNKFDPLAIAVYYKNSKLGYIPQKKNEALCVFLDMGYDAIFVSRISCINKETHLEKQVFINEYLRRKQ